MHDSSLLSHISYLSLLFFPRRQPPSNITSLYYFPPPYDKTDLSISLFLSPFPLLTSYTCVWVLPAAAPPPNPNRSWGPTAASLPPSLPFLSLLCCAALSERPQEKSEKRREARASWLQNRRERGSKRKEGEEEELLFPLLCRNDLPSFFSFFPFSLCVQEMNWTWRKGERTLGEDTLL